MKLLKVAVVALVMAAMVTPVIAEDRLSLNGEMRVRGWHLDPDWDAASTPDDRTDTFADQRLRIGGKIAVAEGVSITFRTDITETSWGAGKNGPGNVARSGSTQQWDRAHMDLTFSNGLHLRLGQQFFGTFGTNAMDTQDPGIAFDFNPGVKVSGFFVVDNQNDNDVDTFQSGLVLAPEGDNFKSKFFVANQNNGTYAAGQWTGNVETIEETFVDENGVPVDLGIESFETGAENVYLIGASASTTLGPINFFGEVDFFTGDSFKVVFDDGTTDELDAMGTQVFLDGSVAAGDAATVGAQFFYAMGDDEDIQYTGIGNRFNGWDPVFDVGTSLSNEQMHLGAIDFDGLSLNINPFDWTGWNAGSVSGRLYGNFKASEDLSFGLSGTYLTVEDDDAVDADAYALAAGMVFNLLENTTFQAQVQYIDGSIDEIQGEKLDDTDFDAFTAGTGLYVKF